MATTYISIDVATRSLAIGVYRMQSFANLERCRNTDVRVMNDNLNSLIHPISMGVYDINRGEKTKNTIISTKAESLKEVLSQLDESIKDSIKNDKVVVLIEYQMNANHGANTIFNMLVYHYANRYPIEVMKPAWKNTIALHPKLELSCFLATAGSNYKANKNHTRYNMLYFLSMTGQMSMISEIKPANQDDIADTLMQAIAFHKNWGNGSCRSATAALTTQQSPPLLFSSRHCFFAIQQSPLSHSVSPVAMNVNFDNQHLEFITIRPWILATNEGKKVSTANPFTRHLIDRKELEVCNWNILYPEMDGPSKWVMVEGTWLFDCPTKEALQFNRDLVTAFKILKKGLPENVFDEDWKEEFETIWGEEFVISEWCMMRVYDSLDGISIEEKVFIFEHPWSIHYYELLPLNEILIATMFNPFFADIEPLMREIENSDNYSDIIAPYHFSIDMEEYVETGKIDFDALNRYWVDYTCLLSMHPMGVEIIDTHPFAVNWETIAKNPAAFHILEQHQDQFDVEDVLAGPNAITYDYERISCAKE